jgi:AraC-like DNA-binding protein
MFTGGLLFLFAAIPTSPLLGNYRKARYMIAGAYLFFVAVEVVKYLFHDPAGHSVSILQTVTLTIAAPQALLFTFAMLALLDVRFAVCRCISSEMAYTLLFIAAVIASCACFSGETFRTAFYMLIALYALLLARYTFLFLKSYRLFRLRMDNYFSDMEAGRLRWVAFSFFAALAVGVMVLLSSLFMSTLVALLFAVVFNIFYLYFAIRFINYAHQFQSIERAMDDDAPEETAPLSPVETKAGNEITGMHEKTFALLEKRIEKWIDDKGFTEQGITIDTLASRLYTNSKYLSTHINTRKNQTFRDRVIRDYAEHARIAQYINTNISVNETETQDFHV